MTSRNNLWSTLLGSKMPENGYCSVELIFESLCNGCVGSSVVRMPGMRAVQFSPRTSDIFCSYHTFQGSPLKS